MYNVFIKIYFKLTDLSCENIPANHHSAFSPDKCFYFYHTVLPYAKGHEVFDAQ